MIEKSPYNSKTIPNEYCIELKEIIKSMLSVKPEDKQNCSQILGNSLLSLPIAEMYSQSFENKIIKQDCEIKQYDSNDKYIGELNNGIKNGIGIIRYTGQTIYYGEWKNNLREGEGICCYTNGEKYYGE